MRSYLPPILLLESDNEELTLPSLSSAPKKGGRGKVTPHSHVFNNKCKGKCKIIKQGGKVTPHFHAFNNKCREQCKIIRLAIFRHSNIQNNQTKSKSINSQKRQYLK